jgi:DNA-binding MarR family transcriptional regulator
VSRQASEASKSAQETVRREDLVEAFLAASRALVGVAARSLANLAEDVTLAQYRVLIELASRGPQRITDLAEALGVDSSTATRMCDRLVRKDLVSRTRDDLDRREVKLAITDPGRKVVSDVMDRRRSEVNDLVGSIPVPLRRQLVSSLTLLAAAAGEAPETHWGPGWF